MTEVALHRKSLSGITGAPKKPEELAKFIDSVIGAENWTYQYHCTGDGTVVCTLVINGVYRDGIGNSVSALYNAALMHGLVGSDGPTRGGKPAEETDCIDVSRLVDQTDVVASDEPLPQGVEGRIADEHAGDSEGSPAEIHADPRTVSKNEGDVAGDAFAEAAAATRGVAPAGYAEDGDRREERVATAVTEEIEAARKADPAEAKEDLNSNKCAFCDGVVPPSQVKKCREEGLPILHIKSSCRNGYAQKMGQSEAA